MRKGSALPKNRYDAVVAVILLLFAVAYGLAADRLPKAHLDEVIEANVYPFVLAALLAALSFFLLFRSFRTGQAGGGGWLPAKEIILQIVFLFSALIVYLLLFRTIGYLSATVLFMAGTLRFIDRRRSFGSVILLSLLVSGICYVLFVILFQIPVPRGILI